MSTSLSRSRGGTPLELRRAASCSSYSRRLAANSWPGTQHSQSLSTNFLVPFGIAVGLPPYLLVAFYPAANSVFFFPTYGTLLAAVSFDQTGTTKIGKLLLNHSFMLPGLVTMVALVVVALCLGRLLLQ